VFLSGRRRIKKMKKRNAPLWLLAIVAAVSLAALNADGLAQGKLTGISQMTTFRHPAVLV
jgi:hypothetical protein